MTGQHAPSSFNRSTEWNIKCNQFFAAAPYSTRECKSQQLNNTICVCAVETEKKNINETSHASDGHEHQNTITKHVRHLFPGIGSYPHSLTYGATVRWQAVRGHINNHTLVTVAQCRARCISNRWFPLGTARHLTGMSLCVWSFHVFRSHPS